MQLLEHDTMIIFGAGGHAKVVIDALRRINMPAGLVLADADPRKDGLSLAGYVVQAPLESPAAIARYFHVAIGANKYRQKEAQILSEVGLEFLSITHPQACVAANAQIASGSFLAAMSVVGPDVILGRGCIINHGAVVDHDCALGDYCHVAPNATLAGEVRLGHRVMIGAGANVLPGVRIGDDCIVGAGAVVTRDLQMAGTYVGVPARKI